MGGLEAFLAASQKSRELVERSTALSERALQSQRRLQALQAERSRKFVRGVEKVDEGMRATFRSLCRHGDCSLEYASQPSILFAEGVRLRVTRTPRRAQSATLPCVRRDARRPLTSRRVVRRVMLQVSIAVKPPHAEWSRFESLSGGQKALVAVALTLSLHEIDAAPFCLFDEVDAALDTQRVQALANHMRRHSTSQSLFVSHRKELIEASARLLGTYTKDGGSHTVVMRFDR